MILWISGDELPRLSGIRFVEAKTRDSSDWKLHLPTVAPPANQPPSPSVFPPVTLIPKPAEVGSVVIA